MSQAFYINVWFIYKCLLYTPLYVYKANSIGNMGNCSDYCKWFSSINNYSALNDFQATRRKCSRRSSVKNCECCLRSPDSVWLWLWGVGARDAGTSVGGASPVVNILFLDLDIDYTDVFCLYKFSQLYTQWFSYIYTHILNSSKKPSKFKHKNKALKLFDVNIDKFFHNFRIKFCLTMTHISEINTEMNDDIDCKKKAC